MFITFIDFFCHQNSVGNFDLSTIFWYYLWILTINKSNNINIESQKYKLLNINQFCYNRYIVSFYKYSRIIKYND